MTQKEQSDALASQWRQHIQAWKTSGQSQAAYCQSNELRYHRFGYWVRKLNTQKKPNKPSAFATVERRPVPPTEGLSIVLPRGLELKGIASANLPVVYQLLRELS